MRIAEILQCLGFNIQLLGSEKYVLNKLLTLNDTNITKIRQAFIKHSYTRFMKRFFTHQLFGKREAYPKETMKTSLEKLAHLIKVCDFLLQTNTFSGKQKES